MAKKEDGRRYNSTICALVAGPAVIVLMLCLSFSFNPKRTSAGLPSKEGKCVGEAWWKDAQCFSACTQASSETSLTRNVSWKGISCYKCHGWNGADPIFDYVETLHGADVPWGAVLDAGTGPNSYPWLLSLPGKTRCDAVTASHSMARLAAAGTSKEGNKGAECNMHVRAWMNDADFLEGQLYDNIIMDYLIGAVEGFEAFTQERLFKRLAKHLAPQGCSGRAQRHCHCLVWGATLQGVPSTLVPCCPGGRRPEALGHSRLCKLVQRPVGQPSAARRMVTLAEVQACCCV